MKGTIDPQEIEKKDPGPCDISWVLLAKFLDVAFGRGMMTYSPHIKRALLNRA